MSRPRIQWQVLDTADADTLWTPGWLPDSPMLRFSLTDAIRVEGVRNDRTAAYSAAESAEIHDGYVGETPELGLVEVTPRGEVEGTGEAVESFQSATLAVLRDAPLS